MLLPFLDTPTIIQYNGLTTLRHSTYTHSLTNSYAGLVLSGRFLALSCGTMNWLLAAAKGLRITAPLQVH